MLLGAVPSANTIDQFVNRQNPPNAGESVEKTRKGRGKEARIRNSMVLNASTERDFDAVFAKGAEMAGSDLLNQQAVFFQCRKTRNSRIDGPPRGSRASPAGQSSSDG